MRINNQFKSLLQLISGSFFAQILTMAVSPITTRLFTKEELGLYTLILTMTSIVGPILSLRYDMSIVTSKNKKEEEAFFKISFIFGILNSLIVTIVYSIYLFFEKTIYNKLGSIVVLFILLLLIFTSLNNVLTAYNNKNKEYKLISEVYVIRSFIQNILIVLSGIFKMGSLGLIIAQLISSLSGLKKQSKGLKFEKEHDDKKLIDYMKQEIKQPIYSVPATLLNTSSYSILNLFITSLYGLKIFGLYSMSYRILGLPLALISTNISKIFFQEATDEYNLNGNFKKIYLKYTYILLALSIPMVIILMVISPYLFELVFGPGWGIAGNYVRILAPMYGMRFIVSPLSVGLTISKNQQIDLYLQSIFIVLAFIIFIVVKYLNYSEYIFFIYVSIAYSVTYIIFYLVIYRISKGETVK